MTETCQTFASTQQRWCASLSRRSAAAVVALATAAPAARADVPYPLYGEPYRPAYHLTPEVNWTNEPVGLFYDNGLWHISYQHNPFSNQFGNQTWGHATSPDLVNWTQQPDTLMPDGQVMAFSGSVVFDENNTSGLGTAQNPPLIAAYTGNNLVTRIQDQRLAYSTDGGFNWTPFTGNPVLDIGSNEIRDPKVLWHEPSQQWSMALTRGGQNKIDFYTSPDLQNWSFASSYNEPAFANQGVTGWEVPDLFELAVDGNANDKKWVLSFTPANGSPAGGNGVVYVVGDFDGATFTPDNIGGVPNWVDYGRDFDGQQSFANVPDSDGRTIWTAVMQSYGESVPTTPWRGQFAIPREVGLTDTPDGPVLTQTPVTELQALRQPGVQLNNVTLSQGQDPFAGLGFEEDAFEIVATFDPGTSDFFGFTVRDGPGEETFIGYDVNAAEMFVDRRNAGFDAFSPNVATFNRAPLELDDNGHITLRAFIDRSSIELFGNDGRSVISDLIFPDPNSKGVSGFVFGGTADLISLEAYPLGNIWTLGPDPDPAPPAGLGVLARWSMDATPQSIGGKNPAVIDQATGVGEGVEVGTVFPYYEPDPSIDSLWALGGIYTTSATVAPASMFDNGNSAGDVSYSARSLFGQDGGLFLPVDRYGEDFAFQDAFTVEMMFSTFGDKSFAGPMQLLHQGENAQRFGVVVNEAGDGSVRFYLDDRAGTIPLADLTGKNYADGNWHYLTASFDPNAGVAGELTLLIANDDGSFEETIVDLATSFPGFNGLPAGGDGNLFIGRRTFDNAVDPRTFNGFIDEVQITSGLVPAGRRVGKIAGGAGDIDRDGDIDADDIDRFAPLSLPLAYDPAYDVAPGWFEVNAADRDFLIANLVHRTDGGFGTVYGDANLDGVVDLLDFDILAQSFAAQGGWANGDWNLDGVVNLLDFDVLAQNFGSAAPATIPEPASLVFLGITLTGLHRRKASIAATTKARHGMNRGDRSRQPQ